MAVSSLTFLAWQAESDAFYTPTLVQTEPGGVILATIQLSGDLLYWFAYIVL